MISSIITTPLYMCFIINLSFAHNVPDIILRTYSLWKYDLPMTYQVAQQVMLESGSCLNVARFAGSCSS